MSWEVAAYVLLSGHVLPPGTSRAPQVKDNPRTARIPDDIWRDFGESCAQLGSNRSAQIIRFMEWMIRSDGAERPQRPSTSVA